MQLTEADRQIAAGIAAAHPLTAHSITRTGPCKVSGAHLSEAPNAAFDLGSPQATADRAERIAARMVIRAERARDIREAKALIRKHQVHGPEELLAALQCVQAAFVGDSIGQEYSQKLLTLICDFEDALNPPEPEMQGFDKRGEYDGATVGVRNRSEA